MNNGDTHTYHLAELDIVCFVCPLACCIPESDRCLHRSLRRLRRIERRAGGDPARVLALLQGRRERAAAEWCEWGRG